MNFFDSHCHLDIEPLRYDVAGAVERAYKSGVDKMINIGSSMRGSIASVELANNYPNIWASVGLHPHEAETTLDLSDAIDEIKKMAQSDKVIAIGEIGLDYFDPEKNGKIQEKLKEKQKALFLSQLEIARELNLPIVFHVRDAWEDFFDTIENWKLKTGKYPEGVVHCFTGDEKIAQKIVDLGLFIGFTGFVTFDQVKFDHIRSAVKEVPLDRILIETDAPLLAPEPHRGKTNEPAYVPEIARKIAEIKNINIEEVAETTYKNTKKVFPRTFQSD